MNKRVAKSNPEYDRLRCVGIPDDGDHRFRAIVIAVPG